MTDTQRIAHLLGFLRAAGDRTVNTHGLRMQISAYAYGDDDGGGRRLQTDLKVLKARGLIRTTVTDRWAGNRDGVRVLQEGKPTGLHLTTEQHRVLTRARREFRRGTPTVSVLNDGPDSPQARSLDEFMRFLRVVEEHGADQGDTQADPMRVGELAVLLGVTRDRVVELIRDADDLREMNLFTGLTVRYDDDTDTDEAGEELAADNDDIIAVAIIRTRTSSRPSPTLGIGLDELGRFAYNRRECDDRLDLLYEAAAAWGEKDPDHHDAQEAIHKLHRWRQMIPGKAVKSPLDAAPTPQESLMEFLADHVEQSSPARSRGGPPTDVVRRPDESPG